MSPSSDPLEDVVTVQFAIFRPEAAAAATLIKGLSDKQPDPQLAEALAQLADALELAGRKR